MNCLSLLFLLKFLGLEPLFNFDPFPNFIDKKFYKIKILLNWSYSLIIFLILLYKPLLETILIFKSKIYNDVPNTLFYYIIPIHYYNAFLYFRSQRKKRIYESKNMEFLENDFGIAKCMPRENTLVKSVSTMSIISIIEAFLTFFLTDDLDMYNNISKKIYIFSKIIIGLSFIPGRIILVINSHVFFFSFLQQLEKIQNLKKKLKVRDWVENKKSSVAILCYEIIDIRYTLTRLIQKTERLYLSTTLIGGVSIGLILEFNHWYYHNITSFIIFGIMQLLFLFIIRCIGNTREDIYRIVHRRSFASKYILRKNEFSQTYFNIEKKIKELYNKKNNLNNDLENEVNQIMSMNIDNNNLENNNLENNNLENNNLENNNLENNNLENNNVINEENVESALIRKENCIDKNNNKDIKLDIENSPLQVKKRKIKNLYNLDNSKKYNNYKNKLEISDDILGVKNSDSLEDSTEIRKYINKLLDSINSSSLLESSYSLTNDDYIKCIYEWSTNTGSSVDWIILNKLLTENWSSFELFGIQFSNGKALSKAIMATSTIIASGSLLGVFIATTEFFG
jgi:hypothetical protein